ncbi:type II toxin-antitoxin system RelE/ParE family toxin [Rhodopseudomonas palustris]|uniref:type II toxin-antitoxin system RelE/ParE family toxin n=1 Tax=Rhodopseudomonas palustris TaxID=1076 RepID=UPI0032DF91C4
MRVFKTKAFARFARRERISDPRLLDAVQRAERGLIDADLGSGVIKQRIARAGEGPVGRPSRFDRVAAHGAGRVPVRFCQERAGQYRR